MLRRWKFGKVGVGNFVKVGVGHFSYNSATLMPSPFNICDNLAFENSMVHTKFHINHHIAEWLV